MNCNQIKTYESSTPAQKRRKKTMNWLMKNYSIRWNNTLAALNIPMLIQHFM